MPIDEKGLTSKEAKRRLEKYGSNILPEKPPPSDISIFLSQLKNPLVYILIVAGLITFLLGHYSDSTIIFLAVFINTILGFVQERRASKALFALKKLIHPTALVIRDGRSKTIEVEYVVPGDIVVLNQGDKIPADGKLIFANRLFIAESILTGESIPVSKKTGDSAFMGTIITSGQARMAVELTGGETEMGKIALSIQESREDTPLKRQLEKFSKQLSLLVLGLTVFVFITGFLVSKNFSEIFITSVALAVSAIPEGLLVGLTVVLAIGMQRILARRGLVRNLVSAETLGGVTTICVDKTGTLTLGKMNVVEAVGEKLALARQSVLANDLDDPVVIAAYEWGKNNIEKHQLLTSKHKRIDSIPFSSKERFFASLNSWNTHENVVFVNGAPEFLLSWTNLKDSDKKAIQNEIDRMTSEGKRLIAMARKNVDKRVKKLDGSFIKKDLEWVGMLAFSDPVRDGVKDALAKTKKAGMKLIVITGDYAQTAASVLNQLGIDTCSKCIMLGEDLAKTSTEQLKKRLKGEHPIKLFARTTPQQKLKIVQALKDNNEVVAMMGDGVNDAPALKRADIGIVVGEASDVAKESADLILLDSSFATIVAAVEEGRGIFDNIRKIILYLISDSFEEIIAVVGTIILGLPLPVTAAQILWINLVSDGLPNLSLTVDPIQKGIMDRPPRSPKEGLIVKWMRNLIIIVSLMGGLVALALFIYFYKSTQDMILARSIAFATLGVNSLVYVFSIRTLHEPFWKENPLENKWLNLAVLGGLGFQILPFMSPSLREFFEVTSLSLTHWIYIFAASIFMFIMIETGKHFFKTESFRS